MKNDYIIGGRELDLSQLGQVTNELPIAETNQFVKQDDTSEVQKLRQMLDLVNKVKQAEKSAGFQNWFIPGTPYGIDKLHKHREFLFAGAKYPERYFSAANRVGKTKASSYEMALHLTGLYPEWWKGRRFKNPVMGYSIGSTGETTRNILQTELVGDLDTGVGGMIPHHLIFKTTAKSGISGAIDTLKVKHVSGGISTLRFKSYDQGRRAFEGEEIDVVHLDEMPDLEVYSEAYTRTMTRNGIIMVTATPLDGLTPLVLNFYAQSDFLPKDMKLPSVIKMAKEDYAVQIEEAKKRGEIVPDVGICHKAVIVAGWDDAPWLDEGAKVRILAATPPHLRQARSTGIPGDSGGMVFPLALDEILVDDFPIPAHWKLINGLDPGWSATGACFCALDQDTDTLYMYADYKRGQAEPLIHAEAIKSKSKWAEAPVIWDYAGMGGRSEEESTRNLYRKHGLRLINANKSVEAGIAAMWERLSTGKLKIFRSCKEFQKEFVTYHRDDKGRIVKDNDHIIDPCRYVVLGIDHARVKHASTMQQFSGMRGNVSGKKYF